MVHIGVLIVPPTQFLDIAPVDLFAMMSQDYLEACKLPDHLIKLGMQPSDWKISFISACDPGGKCATTASVDLSIDVGLDDPSVAPGKLDILVIPGPPPSQKPDNASLDFVRQHVQHGVDLLTICTGVFVAAYAGVLDGKIATGTRDVMAVLKRDFPAVKWEDKRYINDDKIWTAGGLSNGFDMVALYISQNWPGSLSQMVIQMADIVIRPQEYESNDTAAVEK